MLVKCLIVIGSRMDQVKGFPVDRITKGGRRYSALDTILWGMSRRGYLCRHLDHLDAQKGLHSFQAPVRGFADIVKVLWWQRGLLIVAVPSPALLLWVLGTVTNYYEWMTILPLPVPTSSVKKGGNKSSGCISTGKLDRTGPTSPIRVVYTV